VSETVPPAERVGACPSVGICGELLPGVALVGAVCDLAWSRTWPEVFSWYAGVEGNLVYFPSSPSLTLAGRQSERGPDGCLEIKSAPKRWPRQHYPRKPSLMCRLCTESARAPLRSRIPPGKAAPTYHSNQLRHLKEMVQSARQEVRVQGGGTESP